MAGKEGKSGRNVRGGVLGARVKRDGVGKRCLAGKIASMVGDRQALLGIEEGGWVVLTGLVEHEKGWTNRDVSLRWVKDGLNRGERGIVVDKGIGWEDMEMGGSSVNREERVGLVDKERKKRKEEKEKSKEGLVLGEDINAEHLLKLKEREEESFKRRVVEEVEKDLKIVENLGLEGWKERNLRRERLDRERKKREKLCVLDRGLEKGWKREEEQDLLQDWKDYDHLVEQTKYILGLRREGAVGFILDKGLRKLEGLVEGLVVEKELVGNGDRKLGVEVKVRGEVVVNEGVKLLERVECLRAVEGGRSYGEVLWGVGPGMKGINLMELERKKGVERELESKGKEEEERRVGNRMEVVLDSQEELSGLR
ncbi:hypothetical protein C7212DRAFT_341885 [Tuber magnatum]|uniref:Uncharacterized protein n=1 Tax=Tuber magnatum TaxID=42249 RepID=A0A317SYW8_9PEZI|nr:hypothetical protein C7212DRAFT_341885 [Tuber magnatum]